MNTTITFESDLNAMILESIRTNWDLPAFTDYKSTTLLYRDVARRIEKLHILFEAAGVEPGDKIAICGKNSSNWGVSCIAAMTYGAIVVPILHEFKADNVHNIVNHSDAKLLFAGDHVWENLNEQSMETLQGIIVIDDFSLPVSRNEKLTSARENLNLLFGQKFPKEFSANDIKYVETRPGDLAMINYTSGSTGFSKGVMVPYSSVMSNQVLGYQVGEASKMMKPGDTVISMLPMAHMYGFAFEFMHQFLWGYHIYFLTKLPSPKIIFQAFSEVKPRLIISVPLVIEKIIKKNILPKLETPSIKLLLKLPIVNEQIRKKICDQMYNAFGGNFFELIIGGAAFNQEIDKFLHSIHFPYTVGYGATECGPIITYASHDEYRPGSCGKAAPNMEVKILSKDPENVPGEIICRGPNVMLGYYKNDTLTEETIDKDGWMYTGDLGVMDKDGFVYIKGRSKSLIVGPSGQNIYPEEIEDHLNNMAYVSESVVISESNRLVALVFPDLDLVNKDKLTEEQLAVIMEQNRAELNSILPAYEQISVIRMRNEEFEKTPKKSIKRFLYQKE